jgi:hypothetical protein
MRRLSLVLVLLAAPAFADDKAKPNTLTPKEIADGWILLFDGETTFGWKPEGDVSVKDGMLVLQGGPKGASVTSPLALASFDLRLETAKGSTLSEVAVKFGERDTSTITFDRQVRATAEIRQGPHVASNKASAREDGVATHTVRLGVSGPATIAIAAGPNQTVLVHSIAVRPTETNSLFNGKDLTGWKVYDAARAKAADPKVKDVAVKSRYTVTNEGWLNVKNGPGDLQTEGQWADFVAQLECISNGKHLNSGLFFRAIPDLYQQGYEAQIRNEWMGDDRTKPVDFGTGAIYRRQPARKVVSTDGEWFTMTVAAYGRHFATWVNGYQVVDWTDDRKESDNARNGFKKGKGALSIQGHDPTTDLSFRNIRIQSLDK